LEKVGVNGVEVLASRLDDVLRLNVRKALIFISSMPLDIESHTHDMFLSLDFAAFALTRCRIHESQRKVVTPTTPCPH
jgi:hypothetical protein